MLTTEGTEKDHWISLCALSIYGESLSIRRLHFDSSHTRLCLKFLASLVIHHVLISHRELASPHQFSAVWR